MGYRSQVRCVIYGDPDKLQALITQHKLTGGCVFEAFGHDITRYSGELSRLGESDSRTMVYRQDKVDFLDFNGDGYKWYDDYQDVQAFEQLMVEAEELFDLNYDFVRVGEVADDIDQRASTNSNGLLNVFTTITSNIPNDVEVKPLV